MATILKKDNLHVRHDFRAATCPGLLVVDHSMKLLAANSEAMHILTFPSAADQIADLDSWLTKKIRMSLVSPRLAPHNGFVDQFKSARRTYRCRCYPLKLSGNGDATDHLAHVVMLERSSDGPAKLAEICARFSLTQREQEAVTLLLEGLTSKEIAERMKISPNTVKAFLRLIMVKMDVSTRSGILGKIANSERH